MLLTSPNIKLKDVALGYPGHPHVIESVTCNLEGPGLFRREGPNGSGKSTLLEALAGHLPVRNGCLRVCGREAVQGRQESVVFVRTTPALVQSVTMRDHCLLFGGATSKGIERISQLTSELSLQKYLDHVPSQLSSGTRRKFWVALGLLRQTPVLLMDEPFNELDEDSSTWLLNKLTVEAATRLVIIVCHTWSARWPSGISRKLTDNLTVMEIPTISRTPRRKDAE